MMRSARSLNRLALAFSQHVVTGSSSAHLSSVPRSLPAVAKWGGTGRDSQRAWGPVGLGFAAAGLLAGASTSSVLGEAGATVTRTIDQDLPTTASQVREQNTSSSSTPPHLQTQVIFVLGGPGSGKGTQSAKLVAEFDVAHLSAGDLLRAHIKSGSPEGNMVADIIKQGQIVPSEVTVRLLKRAVEASGKSRVLIDGFPRNVENRDAFQRVFGHDCVLVLFFDCPEAVLERRLLARKEGRTDDNIDTIKKRFKVFVEQSMPVIEYYEKQGKVARINTDRPVDEIYAEVRRYFL